MCLLMTPQAPEAAPVAPARADEFRLAYPKKEHLTARQVYELGYPAKAIDELVGRLVLLDVVIKIARDVPLVEIEMPKELPTLTNPRYHTIPAHMVNATSFLSSSKEGERLRIEGIIVKEGYGAYFIYLREVRILN